MRVRSDAYPFRRPPTSIVTASPCCRRRTLEWWCGKAPFGPHATLVKSTSSQPARRNAAAAASATSSSVASGPHAANAASTAASAVRAAAASDSSSLGSLTARRSASTTAPGSCSWKEEQEVGTHRPVDGDGRRRAEAETGEATRERFVGPHVVLPRLEWQVRDRGSRLLGVEAGDDERGRLAADQQHADALVGGRREADEPPQVVGG